MPSIFRLFLAVSVLLVAACGGPSGNESAAPAPAPAEQRAESASEAADAAEPGPSDRLDAVLAAQPDEVKARYEYRHPKETLTFFGVEPGMTVVEGLPGGGWYTKILVDYLGEDGRIIGANYDLDMYPLFSWMTDERYEQLKSWSETFPEEAKGWAEGDIAVEAFHFGSMPESLAGTADTVLLIRALHNAARFQKAGEGPFLDQILADSFAALKPGGVLGIVQHHARDDMSDEFADGSRGYLKKDYVIAEAEEAGFELAAESDVNANAADQPSGDDVVWRLPPSYAGSRDDPEKQAVVDAIGESNRMTLKFVKPE